MLFNALFKVIFYYIYIITEERKILSRQCLFLFDNILQENHFLQVYV